MATNELTPAKKTKTELAEQLSFTPEQLALMKNTVAKGATDDEFMLLLHLAKTYGLDPFAKEIWCIKYVPHGRNPADFAATIFSSRDGYLKIASRDKQMNGIQSDAVCANDTLKKLADGTVDHAYGNPRGAIIGAYALVYRKDRAIPAYFYAPFAEYGAGNNPTWKKYPSAMIVKVAEAMALKRAFSISGLVTQEEIGLEMQPAQEPETSAAVVEDTKPVMEVVSEDDEDIISQYRDSFEQASSNAEVLELWNELSFKQKQCLTEAKDSAKARVGQLAPKAALANVLKTTAGTVPVKVASVTTGKAQPLRDAGGAAVVYATIEQRDEIMGLIQHPLITRKEKTLMISGILKVTAAGAADTIANLRKAISDREGTTTAVAA
ncbi:RecT family recombinase [Hymenobacter sp. H14-R3]|uniref:RecT family recombinase n=1 Tax=Hymenobacter sp. H14-R3 TaxID=3046308 RepID=UPI0024BB3B0C|nr:RecT family recombinase [Hymenobacter sp. H14-R3]MDJ0367410.1 RecT family recombinase [Hymenobacter sp. H14-R3]